MPDQLTSDQFAQQIKSKYPQYSSIDNATLTKQMVAKYPQYANRIATSQPSSPSTDQSPAVDHGSAAANIWAHLAALPGQASDAITTFFPGKQIGNAIGNTLGTGFVAAQEALKGNTDIAGNLLKGAGDENAANMGKIAGDAAQAVALPASLALGAGTGATWWGRILNAAGKYGAVGALGAGGHAAAGGAGAGDTAVAAGTGALTSGLTAGLFQGGGELVSALSKPVTPNITKIQDTIAPKLTAKETQAAINEGRVARGSDSFLFGKQPDIVAQSQEVQTAAHTIEHYIPDAANLNDVQLSGQLDAKTNAIADVLRPQMRATPLSDVSIGDSIDAWGKLQAEQKGASEFLDNEAGNKAFQGRFDNYLSQLLDGKNLEHAWDARIAYDGSIPANVKNATEASAPVLQFRKSMWLQNRGILNAIINDSSTGLGDTSQHAFADMTDMYMARQNIATKAKIDLEGKQGLLPDKKGLLKWGLGVGGGALGLHYIASKLGLPI